MRFNYWMEDIFYSDVSIGQRLHFIYLDKLHDGFWGRSRKNQSFKLLKREK